MNPRFYIYRHIRNDTGDVFYIGKGANRLNRRSKFERAFSGHRKNTWWLNIVQKHGHKAEVICLCHTEQEAIEKEKFFISLYKRREDGGTLVNQTDGGDGRARGYFSDEERAKRSLVFKGQKLPPEVCAKISAAKRGIATSIQKGDRLPQSWRDRIRRARLGILNPMFGRSGAKHPTSRRVIDSATGNIYPSVSNAAELSGIKMQTLYNMLTGFRPNNTTLSFYAS